MMNPKIKEMWIEALESGKYKQGYGQLEKDNQFCCLGVLCQVAIQNGVKIERKIDDLTGNMVYDKNDSILPNVVANWANIDNAPYIDGACAWNLNDSDKLTFAEIAKRLRETDQVG